MLIEKSVIESPNGDIILTMKEDNEAIAKQNRLIREDCDGWAQDRSRRMVLSVPTRLYQHWAALLGEECWQDKNFIKSFMIEHPEFATAKNA